METTKKQRLIKAVNFLMSEKIIRTKGDFAEIVGIESSGNLTQALSEKYKRELTEEQERKFLSFFPRISSEWYYTGEGEMLKTSERPKLKNEVEILGAQEELYYKVPFLDMGVQAGWNIDFRDPEAKDEFDSEVTFRYIDRAYRYGTHIVARVSGDSMDDGTKRSISEGDEILLRLIDDFDWNGLSIRSNLYVIVTNEATVLKQITELNRKEGYIICHSFNNEFSDYRIELEDVRWFFKVCSVVKPYVLL